jgi:uncharacterized protein YdeI (YjbR/CyaY-like superfamily)
MLDNTIEVFYPKTLKDWRTWLMKNHQTKSSVWLIYYKKATGKPTISWSEAVDEALCFGWIDSKHVGIDAEQSQQFFSKRKPKGTWSKINKIKIEKLRAEGRMTPSGEEIIAIAKENGSWTILDEVEEMIVPNDLEQALDLKPDAKAFFFSLSKSVQKAMLQWLVLAKRAETRLNRITEIVDLAVKKQKPKQF